MLNKRKINVAVLRLKYVLTAIAFGCSTISTTSYAELKNQSYENALEQFYATDLETAIIYLKNSLKNNPDHLPSLLLMSEILIARGDGASAEDELVRARNKNADEKKIVPLLLEAYLLQQKYQLVIDYNQHFTNNRLASRILVLKGRAYVGVNQLEQAQLAYQEAAILTKTNLDAVLGLAQVAVLKNKLSLARNYIDKALDISPISEKALTLLANLELQSGNTNQAMEIINQVIALNPQNFPAILTRANLLIESSDYQTALNDIDVILKNIPNEPKANYLKLIAVTALGETEKASEIEDHLKVVFNGLPDDVMQKNPVYHYLSSLVSYHQQQYRTAQDSLDKYLSIIDDDPRALKLLAKVELAIGNVFAAKSQLVRARLVTPEDVEVWTLLGQVYMMTGEVEKAEQYFIDVVNRVSDAPEALYDLARLYVSTGKNNQAIALLTKAKAIREDIEILTLQANAYQQNGEVSNALVLVNQILTRHPKSSSHLTYKGVLLGMTGEHERAEQAFKQALANEPNNIKAFIHLIRMDIVKGNTTLAINRLIEKSQSLNNENLDLLIELGDVYRQIGDYQLAVQQYQKLYSKDQNNGDVLGKIVGVFAAQGKADEAIKLTDEYLKRNSRDGNAHYLMADLYFNNKQMSEAFEHFNLSVKYSQNKAYVLNQYALAQKSVNDIEGAKLSLQRAIAWNDEYIPAYINLNDIYADLGAEEEALTLLDGYSKRYSENQTITVLKGELYRQLGKFDRAERFYNAALKGVPSRKATFGLFRVLVAKKSYNDAAKTIDKWLEHSPNDIIAGIARADLYRMQAQYSQAINYYQQLIKKYGEQPVFLNNIAQLYMQSRQLEQARIAAEKAYKLNANYVAIMDTLAWIYSQLERPNDALPLLREAISQDSENIDVKYHLAVVLNQLERTEEAKRYLREISLSSPSFEHIEHVKILLGSEP